VGGAIAYQVGTSTTAVKTYPSSLTATYALTGGVNQTQIQNPNIAINGVGGITSAQMSPSIATTTNALRIDVDALGCGTPPLRCSNRGTMTVTFNKPVTNPVLHISGLGGNNGSVDGSQITNYSTSFNLTSWTGPSSSVTLAQTASNGNLTVSSSEIRATSTAGGTSCGTAPTAGCGSVRVNGTVTSVTFRLDLILEGNFAPWVNGSNPIDAFTITTSINDDYSDAPVAYQTAPMATHTVGDAYMGAGVSADGTSALYSATSTTSPVVSTTAIVDTNDDGVTFPTMVWGQSNQINVAVTGSGGYLQGWIDWAADNSFNTAGDRIATNIQDGGVGDGDGAVNGNIRLSVTAPAGTTQLNRFARFRWSTTSGLNWNGAASDGEVEDYQVTINPQRNDLSLTKAVSNASPVNGSAVSYTLTLNSAAFSTTSTTPTTGVTVQDTLPTGFTFTSVSAGGTGTYNNTTGVWSVGTLAPGATASITINGTVSAASGTVTNVAQVTASSVTDPDSTANNGVTTEDDYATVPFTVAAILPAPTCAVGATNQIITNGDFASGTGPSWTNWTAGAVWFGTDVAAVNNDTTGGALSQSGLSGLKFGPSGAGGAVIQLSQWWRNGSPAASSAGATLTVSLGGTDYAVITTPTGAGTSATVTYLNGASGNLTSLTEFASTGWRINIPTTVNATGALSFTYAPGGGSLDDDFEIDNVTLYTCTPQADLSLTKTVSNPAPVEGTALSYTLTVTSDAASTGTATGITVQDTLPAGFTFTSAAGAGTYTPGTGVWAVGSLAPGTNAQIIINGTASGAAGTAVTNTAQISASSLPDPDSTANNGVTTEDDYATIGFTPSPSTINCPTGNTSTGSGFATGGTGLYQEQLFWFDWTCGGVTSFPAGSTINKTWDAGDGLVITGQVTNITFPITTYNTGGYGGDQLDNLYPGVNPIGLRGVNDGEDPQFRVVYTATLNGVTVPLNYVVADAESSDGANEALAATTNATNWTLLEQAGALTTALAGNSFTMSDTGNAGFGSAIVYTTGSNVQIDATITQGGLQAMAFGVFTPFDYSDSPLAGTSYGGANHRTIGNYILGASVTTEATDYNSPTASGDVDNGLVTTPNFLRGSPATVNVNVQGLGHLSGWIDFNDDGDWADAGEKVSTDLRDGGAGDLDGAVNGVIQFQVTPPLTAALTPTIARLRYSSRTNAPSNGLWGFGEVEDYEFTILNAQLVAAKTSFVVSDPVNGTTNQKAIPGATVRYCILTTNTGSATAENVAAMDTLPGNVTFIPGTMRSGTTCAGAADIEDFDATGADETNPFGMSTDTYVVNGFAPTLAPNGTFAMVFDVLVAPAANP
jgi:uncharacterized repeat protein (TIGR01451 family)